MKRTPYPFAQKTATKLKQLRKLHGWTQQEVAEKLFIAQTTYSAYERGCFVVNGTLARQLADLYNVSVAYILDDEVKTITITETQYQKLLEIKEVIEEIEKAYNQKK